ncbi:MAG: bifunctional glutamate N-acetyltransferase/amino-acid acetyltransferase ArgJ [Candidatus Omnitrophica bacterium]|nr:bifunctional glutamate N-acetyltransferase/amino-acid acetyltransferase ArgJ [Candidatus Omnitrophota bacterium]
MKLYRKAVLPLCFQANAVACGIKRSGKPDLALFYSEAPAKAACRFTANKIQAAPIKINKSYLKNNRQFQAIIANSGNANCFTGAQGLKDAAETSQAAALALGIEKEGVLVASTGIIGKKLPIQKIKKAIPDLAAGLSCGGIDKAKKAIRTTDTFDKEITAKFNIGASTVTICGLAKGAGMIAPKMACPERRPSTLLGPSPELVEGRSRGATMLAFIFTDAEITQKALDKALDMAVDNSFNCITVDGCMSTNDSVMVLANAAAMNAPIDANKNFASFSNALKAVCLELAKMIVKDAEGATKFIQISVAGARDVSQARIAALSIANSNLFKTAIYGQNPNFGRIVAAIGASAIEVKEKDIKIKVSPLKKSRISVDVSVGRGKARATVYTSDLTPEYIKINAEYN